MQKYDHKAIEKKWQKKWEDDGIYRPDIKNANKPFYNLMMFPYPSAEGLHVGSVFTFAGIDAFGRFMRMQGLDVLEPIGLDAFGIHSENYALKTNTHPKDLSGRTEKNFYRQLHMIGNSFDWSKTLETNKPNYYKWTQWLFIQLFKKGLAERKKAPVNWCPSCLTVLSDEQVINGHCERCDTEVTIKELEQWFFKITEYAERLLKNLDWIDWDESVKTMQKHWIGKKVGAEISFPVKDHENKSISVFTTRADTIYGVTAIALAPEHVFVQDLTITKYQKDVERYIQNAKSKLALDRISAKVKTGVKTGSFAINPISHEEIPIWISDYIIGGYGTGAIMLVPAHDQRDFEFAKQFFLTIKFVVKANKENSTQTDEKSANDHSQNGEEVFTDYGVIQNSGEYSGLTSEKASEKIITWLKENGYGDQKTSYHLRDWLISRQRYWGAPIPIIYCQDCGPQPVNEEDLPVELPYIKDFRPTGTGKSPLASHPEFYQTTCPNCNKPATRETDVSDTFLDSSWYFLRYPSVGIDSAPFDIEVTRKWLPVDSYIGGKEHTVLHLLYSRFITMVLHDLGFVDFEEPYKKFRPNGLIIKDGAKMSKSKGNVLNPDEYIEKYGSDILRCYLAFIAPFTIGGDFRDSGIKGIERFINRLWQFAQQVKTINEDPNGEEAYWLHKTIKKVTEDIKELHYNTAIAAIMELLNFLSKKEQISKKTHATLLQLLAPFAPHITEELWDMIGQDYSIHTSRWPTFEEKYLKQDTVEIIVQVNGKMRDKVTVAAGSDQKDVELIALQQEPIKKYVGDSTIRKVIYIQNKLLNIVV